MAKKTKRYSYALVIAGEIEAPDEHHARLQVEMGFALGGRLLKTDHQITIQLVELHSEGINPNGKDQGVLEDTQPFDPSEVNNGGN